MRRGVACLAAVAAALGCGAGAAATAPEGPPGIRGAIVHILDDGAFRVDDGTATACGFADVRVADSTEVRWLLGGRRASRADLRLGRRVSVWAPWNGEARCAAFTARLVVIENALP